MNLLEQLQSRIDVRAAAEELLDILHVLGEQRAPGEDRPMLLIDCTDDITAESVKARLNSLWELVKNGHPKADSTGYVQVPAHMVRALRARAERAEAECAALAVRLRELGG